MFHCAWLLRSQRPKSTVLTQNGVDFNKSLRSRKSITSVVQLVWWTFARLEARSVLWLLNAGQSRRDTAEMNYLFFSLLFSNKRIMITSIINNIILIITSMFIISTHCSVSQILKITKASQELCESHEPSFKKLPVYPFNCLCFLHIFTHLCFRGFSCIHPSNPRPLLTETYRHFFQMARQQRWWYEETYDNEKKNNWGICWN